MTPAATPEALVDGDHDMPSEAEIEAMREEAENFRLPAPPPTPVRGRFYLTECEHCGWVGSSEHCGGNCGPDDDDIVCPVCCSSMLGDAPNEADTAKHGEAVYQRIVSAEAARDAALADLQRVTAEKDEARERVAKLEADVRAAVVEVSNQARARGEAEGALRASELAGIVDGWRERAGTAEAALATATAEAASLWGEVEAKDRAIVMAKAEVAFAQQDEADGSSHASRRVRFRGILDALNGAGNPAARAALARAATAREPKPWPRIPRPFSERGFDSLWIAEWRAKNSGSLGEAKKAHNKALRAARAATAGEGRSDGAWPSGCIKPNACSRHQTCVYAMSAEKCRHFGQDLTAAIAQAEAPSTSAGGKTDA